MQIEFAAAGHVKHRRRRKSGHLCSGLDFANHGVPEFNLGPAGAGVLHSAVAVELIFVPEGTSGFPRPGAAIMTAPNASQPRHEARLL